MTDRKTFVLINDKVRDNAAKAIAEAFDRYVVTISPPTRSGGQNAMFHAICSDVARSGHKFLGKPRTLDAWKVLFISGHAEATREGNEVVPGLEGEFVNIRESSARMTVGRASSLIEYTLAYCRTNEIPLTESRRRGFLPDARAA